MGFMDKVKKVGQSSGKKGDNAELSPEAQAALEAQRKTVEDVLEVLQIQSTFEIPEQVYMSDDLVDVNFDIAVPRGYDEGQVMYFLSQMRTSISFYLGLLRKRNEDVAKLASVIDKLQVDANNLRFEMEIANGVSVMPTLEDTDLETQNMELKLQVKSLEDRLRVAETATAAPSAKLPLPENNGVPVTAYEKVADELSATRARVQALEEENFHLKSRLALEEDDEDDELSIEKAQPLSRDELAGLGVEFPEEEDDEDAVLPMGKDILGSRPHQDVLPPRDTISMEDDEDGVSELEGLSFGSFGTSADHDDNPRTLSVYDDDSDDSLDELMKSLRGR